MTHIDEILQEKLNYILEKMLEIADIASETLLKNFLKLSKADISYKNELDICTLIDLNIERKTIEFLKQFFPHALFISEEENNSIEIDPKVEYSFIVDPIDGTSNYVRGIEYFAFSIGFAYYGKIIGGVVYAPVLGRKFYGMAGAGAFYSGDLCEAVAIDEYYKKSQEGTCKYLIGTTYPCINLIYEKLSKRVSVRIIGSIAITICYALAGKLDGFTSNCCKLWDIAGALGIAYAADSNLIYRYKTERKLYAVIAHRDEKEMEIMKRVINFDS